MLDEAADVTSFRSAEAADAPVIAALLTQLGYPTEPAEVPGRLARFTAHGGGLVLVAEVAGEVGALAALEFTHPIHHPHPVAHLSAFVVAAGQRRRGLGRTLLAEVERAAADAGCRRIVVTSAEPRAEAHAFYTANGWAYTGRRFMKELNL